MYKDREERATGQAAGANDERAKTMSRFLVKKVAVQLGSRDDRRGEIEILGGLAVGDQVLRSPGGNLSDGQKAQRVAPGAGAASALASAK